MNIRNIFSLVVISCLLGLMVALLWVQGNLSSSGQFNPWDQHIGLYPSIYALWLPALYVFCSGIWLYLLWQFPNNHRLRTYWRYDCLSYAAVLVIFLLQVNWQHLGNPGIWFRGALLALFCIKSAFLFRMLYQEAYLVRPIVLGIVGVGLHLLLLPFHYQALDLALPQLLQQAELVHLATLAVKIIGLNLMALEMFRLANLLARSPQSAIFGWLIVTFTFPVLEYPKISHILAGLLLIFILRMVFSRLDTRELMLGLLNGTNIMILLKLVGVFTLLLAGGVIFWSNVKPGLGLHGSRAVQAAILVLFDSQAGLFCYTPLYWLTLFGMVYVVFFRVWDGVLLLLTTVLAYAGYHFMAYGILDRVTDPTVAVPFLPLFGIFIAIAHTRFGKMRIFRYLLRLGVLITSLLTVLFLLLFPKFPALQIKFSEIQRSVLLASGFSIPDILPSSAFQPFSLKTFTWIGGGFILSLFFCMARTRHGRWMLPKHQHRNCMRPESSEITFAPLVVLTCIAIGAGTYQYDQKQYTLPLSSPLVLSRLDTETNTVLEHPVQSRRIRIVATIGDGAFLAHNSRIAQVTIFDQKQRFETFTLRMGKDVADEMLERPDIRPYLAHGRAALYQSENLDAGNGTTFAAHDYYTVLTLPRRLNVQKIVLKLLAPAPGDHPSETTLNIKAITLID